MDDALNIFEKIKKEEINNNKDINYKFQYDYINSYLDFCFGYPEFKIAKSLCDKYKEFPLIILKFQEGDIINNNIISNIFPIKLREFIALERKI